MGITSAVIGAVGLGASAYGYSKQQAGLKQQQAAQQQSINDQEAAEATRQQQMNLEATRKRREIVRQSIQARASSLSTIISQGAGGAGSSAVGGAIGGISGQSNVNELGINQNEQLGNTLFANSYAQLQDSRAMAAGAATASYGSGLMSLGGSLLKNSDAITKVGGTLANAAGSFAKGFG